MYILLVDKLENILRNLCRSSFLDFYAFDRSHFFVSLDNLFIVRALENFYSHHRKNLQQQSGGVNQLTLRSDPNHVAELFCKFHD